MVVVDVEEGKVVGEVANTPGVHGVALVPKHKRGVSPPVGYYRRPDAAPLASKAPPVMLCCRSTRHWNQHRAMKVYMPPASVLPLPYTRFGVAHRHGVAVRADALHQAHVGEDRHVAHDAHVRIAHGRLMPAADAAEIEIISMK